MGSVVSQVEAPFPERVPWNVEERVVECVGSFRHLPSASGVYYVEFLS